MGDSSKVCYAASEVVPFAKTGGLADVAAALPRELQRQGHDVRVFLPLYSIIDREAHNLQRVEFAQGVELQLRDRPYRFSLWTAPLPDTELSIYLVDCPELFHRESIYTSDADEPLRFVLFCRAIIESCQYMGWNPDLFHCNDWHTALIPILLRTVYDWDSLFKTTKTLVTIHNIGYQGDFPIGVVDELGLGEWAHLFDQEDARAGRVNFLRTGLIYADLISTVSPTYAAEIQTPEYGMGLQDLLQARRERLVGILNGVDYDDWSPENDPLIPHRYSSTNLEGKRKNKEHLLSEMEIRSNPGAPLLGMVTRLTDQKGPDLSLAVLPEALSATDLQVVVLGSGEGRYEQQFQQLRDRFPAQVAFYGGYNNRLAHLIEAGSDMFLMPSRYEPSGLNQLYSLKYGTVPIVRNTGGLADSVVPFDPSKGEGTGFVFDHFDQEGLRWALKSALEIYRNPPLWRRLVKNAMAQNFSWETQAKRYAELYSWLRGA